jgi:twitching motility protein PilT
VPTADGRGRVAAVELLLRTSAVPAILREGKQNQLRSVMQGARAAGMQTMDDALQALLDARRILPQDAYHRATDPERFAHLLEPGSHHH